MILNPFLSFTTVDFSDWKIFFNTSNMLNLITDVGLDGNDYFVKATDEIAQIPDNISINLSNYNPSVNTGLYVTTNGLVGNTDEKASLLVKMTDGSKSNAFAHGNGDYTMCVVYTWDGAVNDMNYKKWAGGKKGFKIESSGMNIADTFNTAPDGSGTASNGITFVFDPMSSVDITTGPFFFCVQRDVANKKYVIYTGEILAGNTASDLKIHDSVSSGWYLTNPFTNNDDQIEFMVDESSTFHAIGYSNTVIDKTAIEATYVEMITIYG